MLLSRRACKAPIPTVALVMALEASMSTESDSDSRAMSPASRQSSSDHNAVILKSIESHKPQARAEDTARDEVWIGDVGSQVY